MNDDMKNLRNENNKRIKDKSFLKEIILHYGWDHHDDVVYCCL